MVELEIVFEVAPYIIFEFPLELQACFKIFNAAHSLFVVDHFESTVA